MSKQRDITMFVNQINNLVNNIRKNRIQLERLNKEFRQSITNISHDLRTPLTTANGYIQILQDITDDKEHQEYLDIILEEQKMVQILLEQLFDYVRIESQEITYAHDPIDAKKILIDTLTMYYNEFYKRCKEPVIHFPETPCIVIGDAQGVKRIFSNIICNAIIHGNGNYRFDIKESDHFQFSFSNASEIFSNDELDYIFDRSYTKDKSRNKKTSGLGLTVAKEITKQLNGTIKAYYKKGIFTICVTFPKYR